MTESKGHLNPGDREVVFDRFALDPPLADVVRHVWVVRWDVPAGEVRPQRMLTYPAFNAVIEPGGAVLSGPSSRVSVRELRGKSWAVGVLLRPAVTPLMTRAAPRSLVGQVAPLEGAPVDAVARAMRDYRREAVAPLLTAWLEPLAARIDDEARQVNEACRIVEEDPELLRATELAARVGVGPRTLERRVRAHVGLTPKWLIDCRRLQHAATTLYTRPDTALSALAAELGYADYAHFSRQYRAVLGETPRQTRERGIERRLAEAEAEAAAEAAPRAARRRG